MNRHFCIFIYLFGFVFCAYPQEGITGEPDYSVLSADSLSADIGLIPESLDADVDSLLHSWHVKYFTQTDAHCHDDANDVSFPDYIIRERLERLPRIIPMDYNEVVRNSINIYAERRRNLVRYMLGMADFYFPVFEQILDEYDLPLELKYLTVVESALNPTAISRVGASGLWQFMLPTGKSYGLEINSLVDERRDPVKATHAACRYFKDMYEIYGDWHLVLASYNCGPGNVNKAIRRAGGKTNFWQIYKFLPRETRSYVPLFIAANYIMNYYCDHNICPVQTSLPMATDTVMVRNALHLQQVADLLQMDIEQIRALNPQYKRDIIPGNTKEPSVLKLPANQAFAFVDKEDTVYTHRVEEYLVNMVFDKDVAGKNSTREQIIHTAKAGENLFTIADKYGVTAREIRKWNGLGSNRVASGKRIKVYVDNGGFAFASTAKKEETTAPPPVKNTTVKTTGPLSIKGYATYTVKSGDSLYSISKRYPGISAEVLQKTNNLPNSKIRPGQVLKIPNG
jgi:membrane-bound lytic murein transglycosylase D